MNLSKEEETIRIEVFWEELGNCRIEQVEEAFRWARGSLAFFPKPKELLDHIYESERQRHEKITRIEWMPPTEEGKAIALDMVTKLKERWAREDEEKEDKRKIEFEKNRERLKKQAKMVTREHP